MCGITGIISENSKEHKKQLQTMTSTLGHRGPDGEDVYFWQNCGLGHRRLSIVDLDTGSQPMFSKNKEIGIVFNGEIYGYKDIRKRLSQYNFKTNSDTEVILALYEEYGENMLSRLPGMFAFAIWDDRTRSLFCARDRFGEKPFYYAMGKNCEFVFASEIKAILASGLIVPKLSKQSLVHYLRELYVDPRSTIYENIFTLPPAHALIHREGKIVTKRYWNFPEINESISLDEAILEFRKLLEKAVENQLIADVPVGAFLSGGLDSSTVVAIASKFKRNLKTFSFAFRDSINELPFAREIAKKYNTDHTELFDDNEPLGEMLQKMQWVYDEPFGDSSNIPTYLIAKLARQYTKVVLTGDGGDELLGGYGGYTTLYYMRKGLSQKILRNKLIWFIGKVISKTPLPARNFLLYRHLGADYADRFHSVLEAHLSQQKIFGDEQLRKMGLGDYRDKYRPSWGVLNTLDDAMRTDLEKYMPGDILVKTDRSSMASGLELRAPFLDLNFASFCTTLPPALKINKAEDKYILRQSFSHAWTASVRKRGKQGFGAPVKKWLKDPSVMPLRKKYLEDRSKKIFHILPFDYVQQLVSGDNYKTWSLLVLSLWMESHEFVL